MALETLKEFKSIGGFEITRGVSNWSNDRPIFISDDTNQISFQIQNKPIKEVGQNGCQVDTIIETAKIIIEGLNRQFPCRENAIAITKLEEALMWLERRTTNRIKMGIEGLSK